MMFQSLGDPTQALTTSITKREVKEEFGRTAKAWTSTVGVSDSMSGVMARDGAEAGMTRSFMGTLGYSFFTWKTENKVGTFAGRDA